MFAFMLGNARIIFQKKMKKISSDYEYRIRNGYEYEEENLIITLTHTLGENDNPQTACHAEYDIKTCTPENPVFNKQQFIVRNWVKFHQQDWVDNNAINANTIIHVLDSHLSWYCEPIIHVKMLNVFKVQWYDAEGDYYLLH